MSSTDVSTIINRLAVRLRLVRVLEGLVRFTLSSSVLLCLALALDKLFPISLIGWTVILAASAALVLAGVGLSALRRVSRLAAAKLADVRLGLDDRLSNACDFLDRDEPTAFMLAHVRETSEHLDRIDPVEAVPFRMPRRFPLLVVALMFMGFLLLLPAFDMHSSSASETTKNLLPRLRLSGASTVESMIVRLDANADRELLRAMLELKRLYAGLRSGELSREEALARAGEVEARLDNIENDLTGKHTARTWRKELENALAEKGKTLAAGEITSDLGDSMKDLKLDEAAEESRSLAGSFSGKVPTLKLTPEQSKALAKLLAKAAGKDGRSLDVLSKEMKSAAENLILEKMKEFVKNLEKMAEELERLKENMEKLKGLTRIGDELEETCQVVSGMRRDASGRWMFGSGGKDGSPAMGHLPIDGPKLPKVDKPNGEAGVGSDSKGPGTGGERTRIDGKYVTRLLSGQWGDGTSIIEIVRGTANEGVATAAYREVAESAAKLAEDTIHSEDIPLGYRLYIKRYFQLIRPVAETPKEKP